MKNKLLLFLVIIPSLIFSQNDSINKKPYDLFIDVGIKFTPFDYLGGAILGLSIYNPEKRAAFNFRNDVLLAIGKDSYINSNGLIVSSNQFSLLSYHTLNYFELDYRISDFSKKPLFWGLGYGWVYMGERQNIRFNSDYGYSVISSSIKYKITWFEIELRGDYALKGRTFKGYKLSPALFPISIGLKYKFKPSKK